MQEAFDESVVLGGEPGWLAVWATGGWAWSWHCWLVRLHVIKFICLETDFFLPFPGWTLVEGSGLQMAFVVSSQMVVLPQW